jgi:hypothetical protein
MTPSEKTLFKRLNKELTRELTLQMRLTEDSRSNTIKEFCSQLSRLVPKIKIRLDNDAAFTLPAIGIGPRIDYCGVPSGNEIAPFIDALVLMERQEFSVSPDIVKRLKKIRPPSSVKIYMASFCRFCPKAISRILPLPIATEGLRLKIIDALLFDDIAKRDRVKSVPTILVDEQYRWTGDVKLTELCEAAENRDPSKLDKTTLQGLITEGGAYDLARMMLDNGKLFPPFIDLLVDENFSVRLAAMVTLEELAEMSISIAQAAIAPLWQRYHQMNDSVKGDIVYIFGELKSPAPLPYLQSVVESESNPEIIEAATEALEKIKKS